MPSTFTGPRGQPLISGASRRSRAGRIVSSSLLATLLFLPLVGVQAGQDGDLDLADLEQRMRAAATARDFRTLWTLVDEASPDAHPEVCELLIRYTLFGESYPLELKVGKLLTTVKNPESRAVIYRYLTSRRYNYKTRIILARVAYDLREDPRAVNALIELIDDPKKEVVLAALQWLREARDRRAVETLIARLEREERRPLSRLYHDINKTLTAITGESLEVAADWKNYWASVKSNVPRPKYEGGHKTFRVRHKFFSVPLDSDKIVFIIDISGSMEKKDPPVPKAEEPEGLAGGDRRERGTTVVRRREQPPAPAEVDPDTLPEDRKRIFRVKQELIRTIKSLPDGIHFTVLAFCHELTFIDDKAPSLMAANPANKSRAVAWVQNLEAMGETHTDRAFERVFNELSEFDTIIFLSDGAPRRDGEPIPEDKVLKGVRVLNRFAKVRIHSIGFLQAGANLQRFLSKLALQNDGTYTRLE